ncbi:HMA2 domain-containing protein [Mesorhizobium sp. M00.F.Ca.ET.216.01.1.1]|uniref:HMA2 domain-containing protein n=1 Tax=Mesorhizobium sp. M00.F.Ca.ET.216.01.1.1 TaxID=2500528 RepID=UPI000FD87260|nr:hypothetical protein [Mesorhizobium sp. M00.F.Ca.ET.216.01.1.1]TGQ39636.1 hypothetical protein EN859_014715 [Mesorhizobium sp. M00.F.Ca.ET.216.01.1.1]
MLPNKPCDCHQAFVKISYLAREWSPWRHQSERIEMHLQKTARVIHRTPGRLRIKIPAARNQVAFFANLQRELLGAEGISSVTVNPTAASLVIRHDRRVDPLAVCRGIPYLAVESSVYPPVVTNHRADATSARELDLVFLLAKLLPLVFARHPAAQLAEVLAEPVLRAVVGTMMRPQSHRSSTVAYEQAEEPMPIAA